MSFDIRNETRRVGIMKNGKLKKEFLKKKNPWTVKKKEASIRGFFRGFRR